MSNIRNLATRSRIPAISTAAATSALLCSVAFAGDDITVGVTISTPDVTPGYVLFNQLEDETTYLIDNAGRLVHSWETTTPPGNAMYLTDDGLLIRCGDPGPNPVFSAGGDAGLIEALNWDGDVVWSAVISDSQQRAHHDIAVLPNGNVIAIAWELMTPAEAIAAGRNPATLPDGALWPEKLIELEPDGAGGTNVVWEWRMRDHFIQDFDATKANFGVVADHPEKIDINFRLNNSADWIHANSIDYNAERDEILLNSPRFREYWVIDHSTTTKEAAGPAGDIKFRWGNPEAYDSGTSADTVLYNQHDAHWIKPGVAGAGRISVFNNGQGRPEGAYSSIDEVLPPIDGGTGAYVLDGDVFGPPSLTETYVADPPESFYSSFISGSQHQPGGNLLICEGAFGRFFEVNSTGEIVWEYINPITASGPLVQGQPVPGGAGSTQNRCFRAERYLPDFPGFVGQDLTPGDVLEIIPASCIGDIDGNGIVGLSDLIAVLAAWGPCDACPQDLDDDNMVAFADLIIVLNAWGTCP